VDEHNRLTLAMPFRIDTNAIDETDRHIEEPADDRSVDSNTVRVIIPLPAPSLPILRTSVGVETAFARGTCMRRAGRGTSLRFT
jgi:hypothetical protein